MLRQNIPLGKWLGVAAVAMRLALCAASAEDRAMLSAVTPDTLGRGEEVKIRWNYEDGNGGEKASRGSLAALVP